MKPMWLVCVALLVTACQATQSAMVRFEELARVETREVELVFHNGDVELSGTLVMPRSPGPHPAIVVVHGSGPSTRTNWEPQTRHFPSYGIALLKFDKRGTGKSGGDWMPASMQTLADDVLAGVDALRDHPDIHKDRIGVWGGSQGWVVAQLAAARGQDRVAFAVVVSGDPAGLWEQEKHRIRETLKADKAATEVCDRVEEMLKMAEAFFRTGEGYDGFVKLGQDPAYKPHLHYVIKGGVLPPVDHPAITYWRRNAPYNPIATMAEIKCPVLSVWGEKDFLVDATKAAQTTVEAYEKLEHPDFTWQVFEAADHGLRLRHAPGTGWAEDRTRLVPGFIMLTTEWVLHRVR